MKKLITTIAVGSFSLASLFAQTPAVTITGTKVATTETPQEVINGVKQKFPDAKAVEYYKVPKGGVSANGWQVTSDDNMGSGDEIEKYSVKFKQGSVKYYALYDKDGTLLQSRYEDNNATLPEPVKESLLNLGKQPEYLDYRLKTKKHYKVINGKDNHNYFVVEASDGKNTKTLYYTEDGKIIKAN